MPEIQAVSAPLSLTSQTIPERGHPSTLCVAHTSLPSSTLLDRRRQSQFYPSSHFISMTAMHKCNMTAVREEGIFVLIGPFS